MGPLAGDGASRRPEAASNHAVWRPQKSANKLQRGYQADERKERRDTTENGGENLAHRVRRGADEARFVLA